MLGKLNWCRCERREGRAAPVGNFTARPPRALYANYRDGRTAAFTTTPFKGLQRGVRTCECLWRTHSGVARDERWGFSKESTEYAAPLARARYGAARQGNGFRPFLSTFPLCWMTSTPRSFPVYKGCGGHFVYMRWGHHVIFSAGTLRFPCV